MVVAAALLVLALIVGVLAWLGYRKRDGNTLGDTSVDDRGRVGTRSMARHRRSTPVGGGGSNGGF